MSDEPPSYFVNGVELLGFRRQPIEAPGEVRRNVISNIHRKHAAPGRSNLHKRDGNLCHYCKVELVKGDRGPNSVSVEHVVPRSLGGNNLLSNLVLACVKCNNKFGSQYVKCECAFCKNARHIHENSI